MVDRWFVVPPVGAGTNTEPRKPKYADEPGITGFSGTIHDFSADIWIDLAWHPETMYVVRFYADRNKELNDIEKFDDAWSERGVGQQEVSNYLNDRLGTSLTYTEWGTKFLVEGGIDV